MLNVVILNGGRGATPIIKEFLTRQGLHVTSVVNAYDDGKSTGEIRRFFSMLGPSDIRKVQELMLPSDDPDYLANLKIFQYRFSTPCRRDEILENLNAFASGTRNELMGVSFKSTKVSLALRNFLNEFISTLESIELIKNEKFNFEDCSLMNCIYAGAFLVFNRNFELASLFIDRLFKLRGTVMPTSLEDKKLVALRENGEMLYSEAEIVELRSNVRIERIYLLDKPLEKEKFDKLSIDEKRYYLDRHHCYVAVSPSVRLAIQQADMIIYSAGTQHSSLYPTYLSKGLAKSITDNNRALKVFMTNIGADYETPTYKASDFIRGAHKYLNLSDNGNYSMRELFDVVFINRSNLKADETYVELDYLGFSDIDIRQIIDVFESSDSPGKHDGVKVVNAIMDIYEESSSF